MSKLTISQQVKEAGGATSQSGITWRSWWKISSPSLKALLESLPTFLNKMGLMHTPPRWPKNDSIPICGSGTRTCFHLWAEIWTRSTMPSRGVLRPMPLASDISTWALRSVLSTRYRPRCPPSTSATSVLASDSLYSNSLLLWAETVIKHLIYPCVNIF